MPWHVFLRDDAPSVSATSPPYDCDLLNELLLKIGSSSGHWCRSHLNNGYIDFDSFALKTQLEAANQDLTERAATLEGAY